MTPIITFILFLVGTSLDGKALIQPIAEFDSRADCETIKDGLSGFPVKGLDQRFICLENTETHKFTQ
jgi:hypothetical protein